MIRFLRVSSPYPEFVAHAYAAEPAMVALPYAAQLQRLIDFRFGYADFWKRHLESTGLFEAAEVMANAAPLQRQWAREHGLDLDPATPEGWRAIVAAQVREWRPEVLFLHGGHQVTPAFRKQLKADNPSIRCIMAHDGVADDSPAKYEGCDVVLSCLESSVEFYRRAGFRSWLLKSAFEASMAQLVGEQPREIPVSFVGAVTFGHRCHGQRTQVLAQLARRIPTVEYRLRIPGQTDYLRGIAREILLGRRFGVAFDILRQWPAYRRLRTVTRPPVYGVEMYRELARAQIALNIHIDAAGNAAANLRLFEATGMGACLVTDWKPNLGRFFEEDREVVTFRTVEECCEKIRYLLDHPAEREAIAARGRQRCLKDHRLDTELRGAGKWLAGVGAATNP